ncbi:MAG TPA: dockerin type I domain-containing protein, partial [Bacteroidales bacterium]|nr:dockerin type I domain-containing protein [Bacteroidales bacterium]
MKRILLGLVLSLTVLLLNGQNYIDGTLLYHNNPEYPIPEAQAILLDEAGQQVAVTTTNENGYFAFEDIADGVYNISFSTDIDGGQVTLADALSIVFYMAGLIDYTEIQELAMDVNGSGSVNMSDFTFIMIQYFVLGRPFPAGEWVFEDVEVNTLNRSNDGSIGGSRTGDSQGVLVPTGRDDMLQFEVASSEQLVVDGGEAWIPISAQLSNQSIIGYILALDFNPEQLQILEIQSAYENVNYAIFDNQVRISWMNNELKALPAGDEPLVNIRIKVKESVSGTDYFTISNGTQLLGENGESIDYLKFVLPELISSGVSKTAIYPNP